MSIRLNDNVAELLGRGETTKCLDVDLVGGVGRHRRLIQNACRHLCILRAKHPQDFVGADVVGSRLVRIYPDPHGILPFTKGPELRNAREARNLISDAQHVVRKILSAARSIRRVDMNAKQQGLDGLVHLYALELDLLRQSSQHILHAIARQHQVRVRIAADLEDHGSGEPAITR